MVKEEHSSTAGGVANWYNHSGNQSGGSSKKMGTSLPKDPAITLLGIYPEDSPACNEDTCSTMFIAALSVIARSWKEPRFPSMEEWIRKKSGIFTQWSTIQPSETMNL